MVSPRFYLDTQQKSSFPVVFHDAMEPSRGLFGDIEDGILRGRGLVKIEWVATLDLMDVGESWVNYGFNSMG